MLVELPGAEPNLHIGSYVFEKGKQAVIFGTAVDTGPKLAESADTLSIRMQCLATLTMHIVCMFQ